MATNTLLAGASGAIATFTLHLIINGKFGLISLCNGMLTGLVAITGCCDDVELWAGVLVGAIGGIAYFFLADLLIKLKIDDPVEAIPVHFVNRSMHI